MPSITKTDIPVKVFADDLGIVPGNLDDDACNLLEDVIANTNVNHLVFRLPGTYTFARTTGTWPEYPFWAAATAYSIGDIVQSTHGGTGPSTVSHGTDFYEATTAGTSAGDDSDLDGGSDTGVSWQLVPDGDKPDRAIRAVVNRDFKVECHKGVEFTATTRWANDLISIGPAAGLAGGIFEWTGGRFDQEPMLNAKVNLKPDYPAWGGAGGPRGEDGNSPNSTADALSIRGSVGGDGGGWFRKVIISDVDCYAGDHFQYGGGDGAIFVNCGIEVEVSNIRGQGYRDSVVYASGTAISTAQSEAASNGVAGQRAALSFKIHDCYFINCDKGASCKAGYDYAEISHSEAVNCRIGFDMNSGNAADRTSGMGVIESCFARWCGNPFSITEGQRYKISNCKSVEQGWTEVGGKHPADSTAANAIGTGNTFSFGLWAASGTGEIVDNQVIDVNPVWRTWLKSVEGGSGTGVQGIEGVHINMIAGLPTMGRSFIKQNRIEGVGRPYVEGAANIDPDHVYQDNKILNCGQDSFYSFIGSTTGTSIDIDRKVRSPWTHAIEFKNSAMNAGLDGASTLPSADFVTANTTTGTSPRSIYVARFDHVADEGIQAQQSCPYWGDVPGEIYAMEIVWMAQGGSATGNIDWIVRAFTYEDGVRPAPADIQDMEGSATVAQLTNNRTTGRTVINFTEAAPVTEESVLHVQVIVESTSTSSTGTDFVRCRSLWRPLASYTEPA